MGRNIVWAVVVAATALIQTTWLDAVRVAGALPDLTLRYGWNGDWGTFGVGALARQLKVDRPGYDEQPAFSHCAADRCVCGGDPLRISWNFRYRS